MRGLGGALGTIAEEPQPCPLCGGPVIVQKTVPRSGRTLEHGDFNTREIPTEHADAILPCLRHVVACFGPPVAVMRDLGRAMTCAVNALVEELDRDIAVLACHQHFLADVGNDLLKARHSELRDLFRRFSVLSKLRKLARDLGRQLGENIDRARAGLATWLQDNAQGYALPKGDDGLAAVRGIAQWVLDYAADGNDLGLPFDRPYLDLYER